MNTGLIKNICWSAVALLGSYLGYEVFDYVTVGKAALRNLSTEEQKAVLDGVRAPEHVRRKLVPYANVTETFWKLNWTGELPPAPKAPEIKSAEIVKQPDKAVSELLTAVLIQYLSSDSKWSRVSVHYKPSVDERLMLANTEDTLHEGDHLPGKYSYIFVSSIQPEYAEFSFEDREGEETRKPERIYPPEYTSRGGDGIGIARVDESGQVLEPERHSSIVVSADQPRFNYQQTQEIRKNQYVIGHKDAQTFNRDYSKILSREVRIKRYRDPHTGRYAGVQILDIQSGSIVSAHGLQAGDIVKSINGDAVTSTQQGISYVKTHADVTSHWVVVVERQGKDVSITYDYTPPEN